MAEVRVFYDKIGNTLTVWFADPTQEHVSEETGDDVIRIFGAGYWRKGKQIYERENQVHKRATRKP